MKGCEVPPNPTDKTNTNCTPPDHLGINAMHAYPNKEELIKQNMQFNQASLSCIAICNV